MPSLPSNERPRSVQLGAELRAVRQSAGLTLIQLAARLGRDHTTVSRWERGFTKPSIQDTSAVLAILNVIGEERDRILELAQHDGLRDWVGNTLLMVREYEHVASTITEVNPQLIPGLLQTREYARSIMLQGGHTRDVADRGSAVRCDRQDVLTRRRPPVEFVAFIGASALLFPPCSDDIMSEQLHRLLVMSARPNISIRIVPQRKGFYSPMAEGAFYLFDLPRGRPVVQLDNVAGATVITTSKKVDRFRAVIAKIGHMALSEPESVRFIKETREKQRV